MGDYAPPARADVRPTQEELDRFLAWTKQMGGNPLGRWYLIAPGRIAAETCNPAIAGIDYRFDEKGWWFVPVGTLVEPMARELLVGGWRPAPSTRLYLLVPAQDGVSAHVHLEAEEGALVTLGRTLDARLSKLSAALIVYRRENLTASPQLGAALQRWEAGSDRAYRRFDRLRRDEYVRLTADQRAKRRWGVVR